MHNEVGTCAEILPSFVLLFLTQFLTIRTAMLSSCHRSTQQRNELSFYDRKNAAVCHWHNHGT